MCGGESDPHRERPAGGQDIHLLNMGSVTRAGSEVKVNAYPKQVARSNEDAKDKGATHDYAVRREIRTCLSMNCG